ncbi:hypothetical protein [Halorussus caseinilyticus]|uniref:Uncharacterized protein n=1 Tax=Halorussus caseinilyticus TaxID=3034025 RepID=A0ABD5WLF1_9EURY
MAQMKELDTSDHSNLDGVTVTLFENGHAKVEMSGTRPADPSEATGYSVRLGELGQNPGARALDRANARVESLPADEVLAQDGVSTETTTGKTGSGSDTASSSDIGTMDHGGNDGEDNYEGGLWVRSEDSADFTLAITEGWIDWTTSGGEADYVDWLWHATACAPGLADWNIDDAGHSYTDWSGDDVEVKFYGDYYDYASGDDSKRTDSYHRLYAYGNPDGSMDWDTTHWYTGEDASGYRFDAGYFSGYDQHAAGHCCPRTSLQPLEPASGR